MQFEALNTNVDTTTLDFGGRSFVIEEGDYNLKIDGVSEIRINDVKGHAGCTISFTVLDGPCAGLNFREWFCVMVDQQSNLGWRKKQFDAFAIKVGKLNGKAGIQHPNDLIGCCFRAHVLSTPDTYNTVDEFGSSVVKNIIKNSINLRGKVDEAITKCEATSIPPQPQQFQQQPQIQQQRYQQANQYQQYQQATNPQAIGQYFGGQQDGNLPF